MARRCSVTGKGVLTGNNVSHAKNRTRRRFLPNLQSASMFSETLKRRVRLRLTVNGIRTIEHNGGIDAWLLSASSDSLTNELRRLKKQVKQAAADQASAQA